MAADQEEFGGRRAGAAIVDWVRSKVGWEEGAAGVKTKLDEV